MHHCLWYTTFIGLLSSPRFIPAVLSFALIAPASASYSTKPMPLRPGTKRTSLKPSNLPKMAVRPSTPYSSGKFCTNKILLGGRYSSGMTAPAAGFEDLSPAPLAALTGRATLGSTPAAGRLSCFANSTASAACFLSSRRISHESPSCTPCCIPFSASLLRLCASRSSVLPSLCTVASLFVLA